MSGKHLKDRIGTNDWRVQERLRARNGNWSEQEAPEYDARDAEYGRRGYGKGADGDKGRVNC